MRGMLALRIDADLAFRRIDTDVAFGDHSAQVGARRRTAGSLDHLFVEIDSVVGVFRFLIDVRLIWEFRLPLLHERLAFRRVYFLDIIHRRIHVRKARWLEALVLIALTHIARTAHRNLEVSGSGLLVIGRLGGADQQRDQHIRLDLLNVLDGLRELRDAQWDEFLANHLSTILLDDHTDPFGRDLPEIVVGGDGVDPFAVFLYHPGNQRRELLFGNGAGDDHVTIADATFILIVVEGKAGELIDDR